MPVKSIPIELGKKTHRLRIGTNAIAAISEKGISLSDLNEEKLTGLEAIPIFRIIFWAGLLEENEEMTLEQAGNLMDEAPSYQFIVEKTMEAMAAGFPGANDDEKNVSGQETKKK